MTASIFIPFALKAWLSESLCRHTALCQSLQRLAHAEHFNERVGKYK